MYRFTYLVLDLPFVAVATTLLLRARRDLRRTALMVAVIGGAAGVISEYFYFRDYWRPPTLFGVGHASVEDFLFGASVMVISVLAYPVLWHRRLAHARIASLKKGMFVLGLCLVAAMMIGNLWLGINSIFVSAFMFALITGYMIARRRDLAKPALITAGVMTVLALFIYIVMFDIFWPGFWNHYWLLYGTRWGGEVLGNIPLTELMWYSCWGLLGGAYVPFLSGKRFQRGDL